jgi:D-alanyl-D-alanine dipeptidase
MPALLLVALLGSDPQLIDATDVDSRWGIDIKYATEDNFTGKVLYPAARCLLRPLAMEKLKKAQKWLDQHHPGTVFIIKDCYRPVHVQRIMWEVVKGTPQQSYVANPNTRTGSIHNYGAAVDLSLVRDGKEVDMGTAYDFFGKLAEPRHEEEFLAQGKLTAAQVRDRHILRDAMVEGGYFPISNEWWHYNALPGRQTRKQFEKLDIPLQSKDESKKT